MSDSVIIVLTSIGVAAIVAVWAVLMWNSRLSARYLWRAVGLILVIVAAGLTGITALVVQGARGLVHWLRTETMDTAKWVGVALAVLGVVGFAIGGAIKAPTPAEAQQRRADRSAREHAEMLRQSAKTAASQPKKPSTPAKPEPAKSVLVEPEPAKPEPDSQLSPDDEVTNILKKHGIE